MLTLDDTDVDTEVLALELALPLGLLLGLTLLLALVDGPRSAIASSDTLANDRSGRAFAILRLAICAPGKFNAGLGLLLMDDEADELALLEADEDTELLTLVDAELDTLLETELETLLEMLGLLDGLTEELGLLEMLLMISRTA